MVCPKGIAKILMLYSYRIVLFLLIFFFIIGCSQNKKSIKFQEPLTVHHKYISSKKSKPEYGGTVIQGSISSPVTLNPLLCTDSSSMELIRLIFNSLLKYDKNWNLVPDLAEKFQYNQASNSIHFTLKKGITWHDGIKLTSSDIAFTYNTMINGNFPFSSVYSVIKKIKIEDDYNLDFYFSTKYAPMLTLFTLYIVPEHILKSQDILRSNFNIEPIGTGPFVFSSWQHDEMVHLTAYQNYFKGRSFIDHFVYRIIPDGSILFFEMMRGKIDFMALRPELYYTVWEKNKSRIKINRYSFESNNFTFLGFNLLDPLFSNNYIRKAINLAIDKKQITQNILLDTADIALGPFRKTHWAYSDNLVPSPYSISLASSILKKNGWEKGSDGILEKSNKKLVLNLFINKGNRERQLVALFIREELKKVGIEVNISSIDWSELIKKVIPERKFSALLLGISLEPDPDDIYSLFHSSQIKSGLNFFGYKNELVDNLLVKARSTISKKQRKEFYGKIQLELSKDLPLIFLYHPKKLFGINSRIKGINPIPESFTFNIEKWYVNAKNN